jgi:hypothetical protein
VFKKVGLRKIGPGSVAQAEAAAAAAAAAEYGVAYDPSNGQVCHQNLNDSSEISWFLGFIT